MKQNAVGYFDGLNVSNAVVVLYRGSASVIFLIFQSAEQCAGGPARRPASNASRQPCQLASVALTKQHEKKKKKNYFLKNVFYRRADLYELNCVEFFEYGLKMTNF